MRRIAIRHRIPIPSRKDLARDETLSKSFVYARRALDMSLEKCSRLLGISLNTASRWENRFFGRAVKKTLQKLMRSRGKAHGQRHLMRKMLELTDSDGAHRYSIRLLSRLFGVDGTTIESANNFPPAIRSPEEIHAVGIKSRRTQKRVGEIFSEAKADLERLMRLPTPKSNGKLIFNLTTKESGELERLMLRHIDFIPTNPVLESGRLMLQRKIPVLKSLLLEVFRSPGYWVSKSELGEKFNLDAPELGKLLEEISEKHGVGLVKLINGGVFINPDVVYLLTPANGSTQPNHRHTI